VLGDAERVSIVKEALDENRVTMVKKTITDTRKRYLCCNGSVIKDDNKKYDGLHCCGDYVLCTYVDDDYLSGWRDDVFEWQDGGNTLHVKKRKWRANPGWGDNIPPPAADRTWWDFYKMLYPGYKIDVFYRSSQ
jgi:hypothetical protein